MCKETLKYDSKNMLNLVKFTARTLQYTRNCFTTSATDVGIFAKLANVEPMASIVA